MTCIAPVSFTHSHTAPPRGVAAEILQPLCSPMAFRDDPRLWFRKTILENSSKWCPFLSANFDQPYRGMCALPAIDHWPLATLGGHMEFPKASFANEKACFEALLQLFHAGGLCCPDCLQREGLHLHEN